MNWIRSRIATSPKGAMIAGKAVFLAGALLVPAALFARVEMIGINAEREKAKLPIATRLAEVFPQYPTWIVPEGPVGYSVAAALVLLGMYFVVAAGELRKRSPRT
jgi:hypothetical protein